MVSGLTAAPVIPQSNVLGRPAPLWIGNPHVVIQRSGEEGRAVDGPILYDNYARQRAALRVLRFEAWAPGITDDGTPEDTWQQIDAQVHFRFKGEQGFRSAYVDFVGREGNNALYEMDLQRFDPWDAPYVPASEVKGIQPDVAIDDGVHRVELEFFFTLNGEPFRPVPGQSFKVVYENGNPLP